MSKIAIGSWGPAGWHFLHTAALAYPEAPTATDRRFMFVFLKHFARVLPCRTCSEHFVRLVDEGLPSMHCPVLASRDALFEWTVRAHNLVNQRLGKPEQSAAAVRADLTRKAPPAPFPITVVTVSIVVAVLLGVVLLLRTRS